MSLNHFKKSELGFTVAHLVTTDDATIKLQGPNVEIGGTCFPHYLGSQGQVLTVDNNINCSKWEDIPEQLPKTNIPNKILTSTTTEGEPEWQEPTEQLPKTNIAGKVLTSTNTEGQPQWEDLDISAVQNITATAGVTNITGATNTEQLTFKAQDNEIINLSTLPNKGTAGYFLTSDGNSPPNLYWSPDGAGPNGIQQTGGPTNALNKVAIYNSNDGLTVKDSNIQYINGLGFNMNQERIANSSAVQTNSISAVNPVTEISVGSNLNMQTNEIQSDVTVNLNAGTSIDCKVASASKLEVTDTEINAKTTLKASNIQEYVGGAGTNIGQVKIQDARLINTTSSSDFLRLDAGGVALNSTGDTTLNSANETTMRIGGIPKVTVRNTDTTIENDLNVDINGNKLQITETETIINNDTTISNNLKVDNIIENTLDNGVNVDGLQIKDTRISNISDTSSKLVLDSAECALVNGSGSLGFNSNLSGTTFRVESVPKIVLLNDDTTINNDLKVDNIVKNTLDNVNVEGSKFRTGGLATINELTVLDSVDVNNNVIQNVSDGVNPTDAVNKQQLDLSLSDKIKSLDIPNATSGGMAYYSGTSGTEIKQSQFCFHTPLGLQLANSNLNNVNAIQCNSIIKNIGSGPITNISGFDMGSSKIINLDDGTDPQDAVNKQQLDTKLDAGNFVLLNNNNIINQNECSIQGALGSGNPSQIALLQGQIEFLGTGITMIGSDNSLKCDRIRTDTLGGSSSSTVSLAGNLNFDNTYKIEALLDGTDPQDAVTKSQLDTKLDLSGGTMSGNLLMGNFKVKSDAETIDNNDYATKLYVDSKDNLKLDASQKADPNGVCPLVNDLIPNQYLPELAITDVYVVENNTARDQLLVQKGDVAIVSNPANNFIWAGPPVTVLPQPDPNTNWKQLVVPTGSVTSVNNFTGTVILGTDDIAESGATNFYYTPTREAELLKKNGTVGMTGDLNMNNNRITNLLGPLFPDNATNKSYVDAGDNLKLNLSGGTMSGNLNMASNNILMGNGSIEGATTIQTQIINEKNVGQGVNFQAPIKMNNLKIETLGNPTNNTDAVNKQYADLKLAKSGDSMTGNLDMTDNNIINVNTLTNTTGNLTLLSSTNTIDAQAGDKIILNCNNNVEIPNSNLDIKGNNITACNNLSVINITDCNTIQNAGGTMTLSTLLGDMILNGADTVQLNSTNKTIIEATELEIQHPSNSNSKIIAPDTKDLRVESSNANVVLASTGTGASYVSSDTSDVAFYANNGRVYMETPKLEINSLVGNSIIEATSGKDIEVKSNNANARFSAFGAFDAFVSSQRDVYILPTNNAVINAGNNISTNTPTHFFGNGAGTTEIRANGILQDTNKDAWGSAMRTDGSLQLLSVGSAQQLQFNGQLIASRNMTTDPTYFIFISQVAGFYKYDFTFDCQPATNNDATVRMAIYLGGSELYRQESFCLKGVYTSHSISYIDRSSRPAGTGYEVRLEALTSNINLRNASFNLVRLHDNN